MPRPGRRAGGLLVGAVLLFAVGTNVQSGWVLALAALLLGAAATGLLMPARMVRGVEVERRAPAQATAGETVHVDLVVRNRSRRQKLSLVLDDRFVAPATAFVPAVGGLESIRVTTPRGPARRGIVDGGPLTVSSSAPFGVGTARRKLRAPGRIVVQPRVVALGGLPILDRPSRPDQAPRTVPRRGTGQDFLGMREYRTGDSLRHVHWPSTARHGSLIVREFEREEPERLGIVVDTWADSSPADVETALDLCCTAAASAAVRAAAIGGAVGLAAGMAGAIDVHARSGRGEMLDWLAGLHAPGGVPLDRMAEAVPQLGRPDSVLVVAPSWEENVVRLPALVGALVTAGCRVQVLVVDAASFTGGTGRALDPAGAGRLARDAGAEVASLTAAGGDLAAALAEAPAEAAAR